MLCCARGLRDGLNGHDDPDGSGSHVCTTPGLLALTSDWPTPTGSLPSIND